MLRVPGCGLGRRAAARADPIATGYAGLLKTNHQTYAVDLK